MTHVTAQPELARRLGLGDAVVIGLGSMIGAGVFAVFAPAARAAGTWLLVGLALAAVVAYCNATSSAQLAAAYPRAGGTYLYGREVLGDWWGFLAGWGFVVGKTASCAAMAMTFAAYAVPDGVAAPGRGRGGRRPRAGQLRRHHPHGRPDQDHRGPGPDLPGGRGRGRSPGR